MTPHSKFFHPSSCQNCPLYIYPALSLIIQIRLSRSCVADEALGTYQPPLQSFDCWVTKKLAVLASYLTKIALRAGKLQQVSAHIK